jgi:hypothetical protein
LSGIAGLYNVPGNQAELSQWSFAHAAHHVDVNRVIFQSFGVVLPSYVLDPFDPENMEAWLYQHQQLHQVTDTILGISGFDLTDVDWKDQNQRAGWIYLNSSEHFQYASILEIG